MARDTSPIVKQSRREGYALHPKANKVLAHKTGIPGQHAHSRQGKPSLYATQLREKQKVRRIYGLVEKQFARLMNEANRASGHGVLPGELLLQLLDEYAVFFHALGNELYVFLHLCSFVGTFAVFGYGDAVLCLVDFGESLLDVVQCPHHVVDFIVPGTDDGTQGVVLYLGRVQRRFLVLIAGCQCKNSAYCHN